MTAEGQVCIFLIVTSLTPRLRAHLTNELIYEGRVVWCKVKGQSNTKPSFMVLLGELDSGRQKSNKKLAGVCLQAQSLFCMSEMERSSGNDVKITLIYSPAQGQRATFSSIFSSTEPQCLGPLFSLRGLTWEIFEI